MTSSARRPPAPRSMIMCYSNRLRDARLSHMSRNKHLRGFTLTELTIVLVIVALLLGGMLIPLSAQRDIQNVKETERQLSDMREALFGFAASRGRLPCPDTNGDGVEESSPTITPNSPIAGQSTQQFATCSSAEGDFPFDTVGTPRQDSWGNRFRYRVTPSFSQSSVVWSGLNASGSVLSIDPGFSLNTAGNIAIRTRGDDPATASTTETKFVTNLASGIPAVIISQGKNGYGAHTADGPQLSSPPASNVDETTNLDTSSSTKFSRLATQAANPCSDTSEGTPLCEFDDILIWVSPNVLYNRMISAGRLP